MRINMKTGIVILAMALLLVMPVYAHHAYQQNPSSCAISTGSGLLQDTDCDKVPDRQDNCPGIPNQDQRDSNNDGYGDACAEFYGAPTDSQRGIGSGTSTQTRTSPDDGLSDIDFEQTMPAQTKG